MTKRAGRHDSACLVAPRPLTKIAEEEQVECASPAQDYFNIASHLPHVHATPHCDGDDLARPPPRILPKHPPNRVPVWPSADILPARPITTCLTAHATFSRPVRSLAIPTTPPDSAPVGYTYTYTPVSARPATLESFRYDYGIRYKKRIPINAVLGNWRVLLDEDAAPCRFLEDVIDYMAEKEVAVKKWFWAKFAAA